MKPGDLFERYYQTAAGEIGLLAEVAIERTTLILKDVAVYPVSAVRLDVGTGTLVEIRDALAREIAAMGFSTLRVIGKRVSGAAPGKEVDVTIDLARYR